VVTVAVISGYRGYDAGDTWYVVLDTSVFHEDFDLSNRETSRLLTDGPSQGFQICVPEVVIQEMVSHCRQQVVTTRKNVDDARRFLTRLLGREVVHVYTDDELRRADRAYETRLRRLLRERGVRMLPLPTGTVSSRSILRRHQLKRKPFKQDGQGLPDVFLWESVLALCRREPRPVALITANPQDFAIDRREHRDELHAHLVDDLADLGIELAELHTSIGAFNSARLR